MKIKIIIITALIAVCSVLGIKNINANTVSQNNTIENQNNTFEKQNDKYEFYENAPFYHASILKELSLLNKEEETEKPIEETEVLETETAEIKVTEATEINTTEAIETEFVEIETTQEPTIETIETEAVDTITVQYETQHPTIEESQVVEYHNVVTGQHSPYINVRVSDLNSNLKQLAYYILDKIEKNEYPFEVEGYTFDEILYVLNAIQDTYFMSYLDSETEVVEYDDGRLEVNFKDCTSENYRKVKIVRQYVADFGNSLIGLTEENAVKKLYDFIRNNTTYQANTRDLYTLVTSKISNCESNSQFFEFVCNKVGIECHTVIGDVGEGHAWNRVKVDDKWYYIDCTIGNYLSENLWDEYNVEIEYVKEEAHDTDY